MAVLNVPLATFAGLLKNSLVEKRLQKFCQCCKNFMRIWFYAKLCRVCRHMNMKAITIRIRVCIIRGLPGIIPLIFRTKKVFQRGLLKASQRPNKELFHVFEKYHRNSFSALGKCCQIFCDIVAGRLNP